MLTYFYVDVVDSRFKILDVQSVFENSSDQSSHDLRNFWPPFEICDPQPQ